jgi:hypothetical protein
MRFCPRVRGSVGRTQGPGYAYISIRHEQTGQGGEPAEAEDGAEVVGAVADVDDPVKRRLMTLEECRELVACTVLC